MYTEGTGNTSGDSEPDSSPVASRSPINRVKGKARGEGKEERGEAQ